MQSVAVSAPLTRYTLGLVAASLLSVCWLQRLVMQLSQCDARPKVPILAQSWNGHASCTWDS